MHIRRDMAKRQGKAWGKRGEGIRHRAENNRASEEEDSHKGI